MSNIVAVKKKLNQIPYLMEHIDYCQSQNLFNRSVIAELPHLALTYEEDLAQEANHQKALDKICQFIEIDSAPAVTSLAKVLPSSISEYISNYRELTQAIADSPYAPRLAGLV